MIKNGVYMNRNNYKFGKLLKDLRQKNNMTQEELSYRSFINVKTLSNMENGKVDFDLDMLEILSEIFNIDLVEKYLYLILDDSSQINKLVKNLNSKDRYPGSIQADEIRILTEIENTSHRKIIRLKAKKLRLLFQSVEIKDDKNKKKSLIVEALNVGRDFDFKDLSSNTYDIIDYRLLMNYAIYIKYKAERLKILKFIENSRVDDDNLNSILYHNISNTYYTTTFQIPTIPQTNPTWPSTISTNQSQQTIKIQSLQSCFTKNPSFYMTLIFLMKNM